ncbi:MAG: hypothetical protein JW829_09895 [Pirellulales bacterium]|nr:hypothetical protein [Pirellulales bacterium]
MKLNRGLIPAMAIVVGLAVLVPPAWADILEAVEDSWIRQDVPATVYAGDLISVWAPGTDTIAGGERLGVIQWDIASFSVPITSAVIQLYDRNDVRAQTNPLVQQAFLIDPPEIMDYTYEEYEIFDQATEVALETLGTYSITPPDNVPGYETSGIASPSDLNLLNSRRTANGGSGLITLILEATDGQRDWSDIEYDSHPPLLYLNEAPPSEGDWNGDGQITTADYAVITANWLQEVEPGTLGDHNADGTVDLFDFDRFKEIFSTPGNGRSIAVPEPSGVALCFISISLMIAWRRR